MGEPMQACVAADQPDTTHVRVATSRTIFAFALGLATLVAPSALASQTLLTDSPRAAALGYVKREGLLQVAHGRVIVVRQASAFSGEAGSVPDERELQAAAGPEERLSDATTALRCSPQENRCSVADSTLVVVVSPPTTEGGHTFVSINLFSTTFSSQGVRDSGAVIEVEVVRRERGWEATRVLRKVSGTSSWRQVPETF